MSGISGYSVAFPISIATINKSPGEWVNLPDDEVIAIALLERIHYHCEEIMVSGKSYRL